MDLSDVSQSPIIMASHSINLFFHQQSFFLLLSLNIRLDCSSTVFCNFLTFVLASTKVKLAEHPFLPASLQSGQTKQRCFHWNVRVLNCCWLKRHRLPPCPRPVLHTTTLISWKDTRSCCFCISVHVKKIKNPFILMPSKTVISIVIQELCATL